MFTFRQPILQEFGERKHQNPPHTGVPQTSCHKGSSSNPRNEILVDCQMLVDHIVKEYPEGFNMGSFRKLFLEKHGYALDLKKIGYKKLDNLLQIFPGIKIESNLIIPIKALKNPSLQTVDLTSQESKIDLVANSDGESSVLSIKDNDSDSWDELGPIDYSSSQKEETKSGSNRKDQTGKMQSSPYYEPLEEDNLSDSEDEKSFIKSENGAKSKVNDEESSLLQILESWYSEKEGGSSKEESENVNSITESSENTLKPSTLSSFGSKTDSPQVNHTKKRKPDKKYSFVLDQPVDDNDKLVDGILGSMKKPVQEPC